MTLLKELGFLALATRIKTLGEDMLADGLQIYAGAGVTFQPRWFSVFYLLQEHKELTITDVAHRIGLSHPAIIKNIESMEEAGLIESNRNSRDGRKRMISLTQKGEALIPELQPIWKALDDELRAVFASLHIDILGTLGTMEDMIRQKPISQRVHERLRRERTETLEFKRFAPSLATAFRQLNEAWLNEYFSIEDEDRLMLEHPEKILIENGEIFFACVSDLPVGTLALVALEKGVFEIAKMAVDKRFRNRGIGKKLLDHAIEEARRRGATRLILHTSSKLEAANHLYQKLGFVEERLEVHLMKYLRPSRRYVLHL